MSHLMRRDDAQALQVSPLDPPVMSRDLATEVARLADPDPEMRALRVFDPAAISDKQRDEAADALRRFKRLMVPVTRAELAAWLGAVNAACRNPLDEAPFRVRLNAIAQDCGHLPAGCWTAESRRTLYLETRFFPAAGDVLATLEPIARDLRGRYSALQRLAAPAPVAAEVAPPAEERPDPAALRAQVAALKRDIAAAKPPSARAPVKAAYLNHNQLVAMYRAQVEEGRDPHGLAAMRLAHLERNSERPFAEAAE